MKPRFHANLDDMKFWVCSALVDVPTVLRLVRLRWGIEVVFRYLKQRFKLETCIIRTPEILLVWWKLLWNAFNTIADIQDYGRNWASARSYWLSRRNPHATMHSALEAA
ncbi:Transposase DDE domain protein [compost metagenome]